jgi:hypothetical protein
MTEHHTVLRYGHSPQQFAKPSFNGRVPRSAEEIATLLSERPEGWEYLLYAAKLLDGNNKLQRKYQDHRIKYTSRPPRVLSDYGVADELARGISSIEAIADLFNRLLAKDVQDAAFGRLGEPGDPDRVLHIATRMCSAEEELLDRAASVRAIVSTSHARKVLGSLAAFRRPAN